MSSNVFTFIKTPREFAKDLLSDDDDVCDKELRRLAAHDVVQYLIDVANVSNAPIDVSVLKTLLAGLEQKTK